MTAMSFLYLLTGCLDLALREGQKKQREPQAGKTWREITPETLLIFYNSNTNKKKPNKWRALQKFKAWNYALFPFHIKIQFWTWTRERKAKISKGHPSNSTTSLHTAKFEGDQSRPEMGKCSITIWWQKLSQNIGGRETHILRSGSYQWWKRMVGNPLKHGRMFMLVVE